MVLFFFFNEDLWATIFLIEFFRVPWWLELQAFTAMIWIQSLVWELRSHKPRSTGKKKKDFLTQH